MTDRTEMWNRARAAAGGAWGRAQEVVGRATRNRRLQAQGAAGRATSAVRQGMVRVKGRLR